MIASAPISGSLAATLCGASYLMPPTWQVGDVRAARFDIGNVTVVAMPGTRKTSIPDWMRDADAVPLWNPVMGVCHRGFLSGALSIFPLILRDLIGRLVVVTGHSLGGAMSLALAALLKHAGITLQCVHTFGSPRLGFGMARQALDGVPVYQWCDGNDFVPRLIPPYEHIAELIECGIPMPNAVDAHAIARYAAVVAAAESSRSPTILCASS